jgi:ferredoxin
MTYVAMQHIPLSRAYLCQDCNSVGNCAERCPACASHVLMGLATILDRESQELLAQEPALIVELVAA